MGEIKSFGSPVLSQKLKDVYGSEQYKDNLPVRKSQDVSLFLKEKERREKESYKTKMSFK